MPEKKYHYVNPLIMEKKQLSIRDLNPRALNALDVYIEAKLKSNSDAFKLSEDKPA